MTGVLSGMIGSMKGATAPKTAPTSLSAIPVNTSVAISFTAPSDDGGSPITNYEYSFNNSSWTALSPADATSPVTVSGLTQNTAYSIYLRAVNAVGSGPASSAVSFTTEGVPTGAVTINSVTTGITTATVTFSVAAGGGAVTGYDLYITNATNAWNATTASPISVTGLSAYSSYDFYVRTKNAYGVGPQSAPFTKSTINVPTTTINAVNNVNQSRGTFNATISANGSSTTVYFQYNTNNNFAAYTEVNAGTVTTQSAAVSYTQTGLSTSAGVNGGGVSYYVRVAAVNSAGTTYSGVTSFNTWGLRAYSQRTVGTHNMTVPTVSGLVPASLPEVYIIGSGGGGGYTGSGGGAGGLVVRTNAAFTAADGYMTIVIGAPGAGGYNLMDGNTGTFNGVGGGYCQLYGNQFSSLVAGGGGGGAYEGYGGNVGSGDNPAYTGGNYAVYISGKTTYKAGGGGAGNDGNGGNGVATATGNVVSGNGGPGNGFWGNAGGGGGGDRNTPGANGSPYNVGAGGIGGAGTFENGSAGAVGQVYFTYYGP
jgi:hypothetical protein